MNMKSLCLVALGVSLSGVCLAGAKPASGFARIMSELDGGGEYLEVLNAPTFQSDINAGLDFLQAVLCEFEVLNKTNELRMVRNVRKAVTATGALALRGFGSSVSKLNDTTYRHRSFVLTEGKVPLFDLAACGVRPWTVESYLPNSTVLAASFSADLKGCVRHAADVVKPFHFSTYMMLRGMTAKVGRPSPLDGFQPGTVIALTLDAASPWKVPEADVRAPTPGFLFVQAVKGKGAWEMLKNGVMGLPQDQFACSTLTSPKFPELDRLVLSVPEGDVWNFTPACAYDARNGVIVIASSPELLDAALAAGIRKEGRLLDDPALRANAVLPEKISGFAYLSPKFLPALADVGRQLMMQRPGGAPTSPTLMKFLENPPTVWFAGTVVRVEDGITSDGYSSIGACGTLRALCKCGLPQILGGVISAASKSL